MKKQNEFKSRKTSENVLKALDNAIADIQPPEMKMVYVLARESGWRDSDVLNLKYDTCLQYEEYDAIDGPVPLLCGTIAKAGISELKIPISPDVAATLSRFITAVKGRSTDENNPEQYLFNIFDGERQGSPLSRREFVSAVNGLIARKDIRDESGELYKFRAHDLRYARVMEYEAMGLHPKVIEMLIGRPTVSKDSVICRI